MSCSYGPGRYDVQYEEKGRDYPIGYVRWTENRNMQAFIDLLKEREFGLNKIISHEFNFNQAEKAYDIVANNSEPYLGILLKYDNVNLELHPKISFNAIDKKKEDTLAVGFIGAGSFAQKFLLPYVKDLASLKMVSTKTGIKTANIARKYGFENATNNNQLIIDDKEINTVFIATRHDVHAKYVIECLRSDKNIFVEKPLCLREQELETIREEYNKHKKHLMIGFNRRFAPQIQEIIKTIGLDSTKTINYRINLGPLDPKHWTQDPEIGGGRIIGEVCHFIDLCMYIANSKPEMLTAFTINDPLNLGNTLSIMIKYLNGSIANINYYANGNEELGKEYLEVHSNGISCVLDDFVKLTIFGRQKRVIKSKMDKGHKTEVAQFLEAVKNGKDTPIPFSEIYWSTKMTFDIITSLNTKQIIKY